MKAPILVSALLAVLLVLSACRPAPMDPTPIVPDTPASTFKEYKSTDAEQCKAMRFTCGDTGEYFGDETGCGCILPHTDAAVTLCSADYDPVCGWSDQSIQCFAYPCAQTYSNLCMASIDQTVASTTPGECPAPGSNADEGKQEAFDCPAERTQACTREYLPVCGQQVLNTGEVVKQTYGNSCTACAEMKVVSYTQGACAEENGREYISRDQTQCAATDWICGDGMQQFYDETGCGCEPIRPSSGMPVKKPAVDCTEPRPEICTLEYMPVCGQKTDGTSMTYGNKCGACADKEVLSYTQDACASDFVTYAYQPKQCEQTPWQVWYANGADGYRWVSAPTDEELITAYYGSKNVDVTVARKVESGLMTCEACDVCPTSYSFTVTVNKHSETKALTADNWTLRPQNA